MRVLALHPVVVVPLPVYCADRGACRERFQSRDAGIRRILAQRLRRPEPEHRYAWRAA